MRPIFIDANIYLDFYSSKNPKILDLLDSLLQVRDSVFVTEQVRDEVLRNRARCASELWDSFRDKIPNPSKVLLPTHVSEAQGAEIKRWNGSYKNLRDETITELGSRFDELRDAIINEVISGTDAVSQKLAPLWEQSIAPTIEVRERAKSRKERGNPPGKPKDPIGDELSWEQFLEAFGSPWKAWVVSGDFDYFVALREDRVVLNPFLDWEIRRKAAVGLDETVDVFSFVDLRTALDHFSKQSGQTAIGVPTEEGHPEDSCFNPCVPLLNRYFPAHFDHSAHRTRRQGTSSARLAIQETGESNNE